MPVLIALGTSAAAVLLAFLLRALSASGAGAAGVIGSLTLWATGWFGAAVLGVYFIAASGVSRLSVRARGTAEEAKAEVRNHRQVLANGGFAALGAAAEPLVPGLGLWLLTIGLAAACADTWATALGSLSPRAPRDLLSRRPVSRGTSGGVTGLGTSGGILGAGLIGLLGTSVTGRGSLMLAAAGLGTLAMRLDSALGSRLQVRYHCAACDEPTENSPHRCGAVPAPVSGIRWLDNDGVNAVANAVAVLGGLLLWPLVGG
ncbi:MAG: DUF92 domain-containing protein [Gemmatimonadales bacterium]